MLPQLLVMVIVLMNSCIYKVAGVCRELFFVTNDHKGEPYRTVSDSVLYECIALCEMSHICTSATFEPQTRLCRLKGNVSNDDTSREGTTSGPSASDQQLILIEMPTKAGAAVCPSTNCNVDCSVDLVYRKACATVPDDEGKRAMGLNGKSPTQCRQDDKSCSKATKKTVISHTGFNKRGSCTPASIPVANTIPIHCDLHPNLVIDIMTNMSKYKQDSSINLKYESDTLLHVVHRYGKKHDVVLNAFTKNSWGTEKHTVFRMLPDVFNIKIRICPQEFRVQIHGVNRTRHRRNNRLPTVIKSSRNIETIDFKDSTGPICTK